MITELLSFMEKNIVHIGYWIAMIVFGLVIRSIVNILSNPYRKRIKLPFHKKPKEPEDKEENHEGAEVVEQEQIDKLFPP